MAGPNILMYFPWSRPDEEGAPLGQLDNRFGALFELLDRVDILIIVSFDSQRTDRHPNESELTAIRNRQRRRHSQ
jgi:hypothetical protein